MTSGGSLYGDDSQFAVFERLDQQMIARLQLGAVGIGLHHQHGYDDSLLAIILCHQQHLAHHFSEPAAVLTRR